MPRGRCMLIVDGEAAIVDMPEHWKHLPMKKQASFIRPSEVINEETL